MQDIRVELLRILQKGEMTYLRLNQKSAIWNLAGHEKRVLALDYLIMIGIYDPGWDLDARKIVRSEIWLGLPHLFYLGAK